MADAAAPSGVVHWIGAGLSTGSGLAAVCDTAAEVRLWHRSVDRAEQALDRLGLSGRARPDAFAPAELAGRLRGGDVVVSMLPATEHPALLRLCVERGAHFACTSYVSAELDELAAPAAAAGVTALTEAGLDPGIDHLFAHSLIERATTDLGADIDTVRFVSYCGGIPAVPNDFRYRFSWAPLGVLNALRTPARYVDGGAEVTTAYPWEATRPVQVGAETFEVYPNRDSIPFLEQYRLPKSWQVATFVRGTLRLAGWRAAWAEVFETVRAGDDTRIAALAGELATRYPTTDTDHDRVVLLVGLEAGTWSGRYHLDLTGDGTESAMARCVSQPLAFGVTEILRGAMPAGLRRAAESAAEANDWLSYLDSHGVGYTLEVG